MSGIRIVRAGAQDVEAIAQLHAASWRASYAQTLPLADAGLGERLRDTHEALWRNRLARTDDPALRVWKACYDEDASALAGFVCALSGTDGILLDNLHVAPERQGCGIGRALFDTARTWAHALAPKAVMYLWVLAGNTRARGFYDHLGGTCGEAHPIELAPGLTVPAIRYAWHP